MTTVTPKMPIPAHLRGTPPQRKTFQTADDVDEAYAGYKAHCLANPIPIGSRGRTTPTPETWVGFAVYCGTSRQALARAEKHMNLHEAFQRVRDSIEASLTAQGLTKSLDANLVARVAGIADKQHIAHTEGQPDETAYDWSKLDNDEMAELQRLLEKAAK